MIGEKFDNLSITGIDLAFCGLGNEEIKRFSSFLKSGGFPRLEELGLGSNSIDNEGIRSLIGALNDSKRPIKIIDFSANDIDNELVDELFNFADALPTLTKLDFRGNYGVSMVKKESEEGKGKVLNGVLIAKEPEVAATDASNLKQSICRVM